MRVRGFWSRGITAFFDVRVMHANSKCNKGKATSTILKGTNDGMGATAIAFSNA